MNTVKSIIYSFFRIVYIVIYRALQKRNPKDISERALSISSGLHAIIVVGPIYYTARIMGYRIPFYIIFISASLMIIINFQAVDSLVIGGQQFKKNKKYLIITLAYILLSITYTIVNYYIFIVKNE